MAIRRLQQLSLAALNDILTAYPNYKQLGKQAFQHGNTVRKPVHSLPMNKRMTFSLFTTTSTMMLPLAMPVNFC